MLPQTTYQIALSLFPGIGPVNSRRLVAYLGNVENVFSANKKELEAIPGVGAGIAKTVTTEKGKVIEKAQREEEFICKHKIQTYFYLDKTFPKRLAQCDDAPVIIYQKGNADLNASKVISIVGTRSATEYGRQMTIELVSGLAEKGISAIIVSGLAYGIDIQAHKSAMKFNMPTIAVVGHGLDRIYPSAHNSIAREMVTKGGILTDFASGTSIDPGNFLRRNRIIAGLADATIVVESAAKGGALVTADIASSYNRDVFAFPGRSHDPYSVGCNALIKSNKAGLIESVDDLIEMMGWNAESQPRQQLLFVELDDEEKALLEVFRINELMELDQISKAIGLQVQYVNPILLRLEFKGVVKGLPGSRFKLLNRAML